MSRAQNRFISEWKAGDSSLVDPASLRETEFQTLCGAVWASDGPLALWQFIFDISVRLGYILPERLKLDIIYDPSAENPYEVPLQISINCSKPEIVAGAAQQGPTLGAGAQCVICYENVDCPAKPGLRACVFELNHRDFFIQYPPYPYTTGHAVVIEKEHTRQIINANTSRDLLVFVDMFPGIYIASNTDKTGTGASVLAHRHYQAVRKRFGVFDAMTTHTRTHHTRDGDAVEISVLKYPCVALKLRGASQEAMQKTILTLLHGWREVVHESLGYKQDDQTMSYLVYKDEQGQYEVVMIPRNRTKMTKTELHAIKKEFVGILEMAGYAVLPARLDKELKALSEALSKGTALPEGMEPYRYFVDNHYSAAKKQGSGKAAADIMKAALYLAFAEIIADNSAYDPADDKATMLWLDEALQGRRRLSVLGSMLN